MSFHWEADLDLSGRSTLAIRPIIWKNGWPEAGEILDDGTYKILSRRRGYALELTVDFVRAAGGMRGFGRQANETVVKVENQKLEEVIGGWPEGNIDVRANDYMARPHQKWTIEAIPSSSASTPSLTAPRPWRSSTSTTITPSGTSRSLSKRHPRRSRVIPDQIGDLKTARCKNGRFF